MKKRYLALENGRVFEGYAFGAEKDAAGELVFTTAVGGYMETLTDARFFGQLVVMTFPMLGNYGCIEADAKGLPALFGVAVREVCDEPSNFRSEGGIDAYLKEKGIPGICGVDTRGITRVLREEGVMRALLSDEAPGDIKNAICDIFEKSDGVRHFSAEGDRLRHFSAESAVFDTAVIDFGCAGEVVPELLKRGCSVTVYPQNAAEDVLSSSYDGVVLTGGAGDPREMTEITGLVKKLSDEAAVFAVGLGHQLLALACGGAVEKLRYGHRGANVPVRDVSGTRTYVTPQNHGYVVLPDGITGAEVSYKNMNDGTCEGLLYENGSFSVQFPPVYCKSPNDTSFLYDRFTALMGGKK